ncbi:glycerol kinase GlpK [Dyadobacter fanqingshengii]|uniref:Glycerol kinase n=1 Tax=Dyadobacter fanqingshengii TaxID=2906443 RepID=A0A9X1PEE5_9BACT|nr:glycerol kinase GlpK [Dyadobacter fanqingshengii]MCF0043569.1 glycerol kinase GlpK [Dyadobacter fanqingshengii]USJ34813.1 glycerol kinase GlpK [Dyadobacter fanqingshengii]
MSKYVAAIDQGTTSTRCILFNHQGNIVSVGQKEHEQIYPHPGWVEHNPTEIWKNTLEVIAIARINVSATAADIAAIGITNQRETTVVWNKRTGKPYYNALVWQDTRTTELVAKYEREGGLNQFREITGLPVSTYFSGLKLKWLLDNVEGIREDAEKGEAIFGNMDTFLIWHLTGGTHGDGGIHVTDVTNASRTQLMNLKTLQWDKEMLAAYDIPENMLPAIKSSSEIYGYVNNEILPGVPVAGDLGDQHAALVGQTCFKPGMAKNTYGTGCFLVMNTGNELKTSENGLLTTIAYKFGDNPVQYALEGSVAVTGALVQWVRDNLGLIKKSSDIEKLAQTVEDNGGAYFVPAFSGLYAPYWRNDARGVIAGLTGYVNKGHIARAVLEASAYQTLDVVRAMEQDSGIELASLRVDGGMVANELLMQFQSDILNTQVVSPAVAETTALGAAYAAGLAVGYWKNTDELTANWAVAHTWNPNMEEATREKFYKGWQKAVTKSYGWMD